MIKLSITTRFAAISASIALALLPTSHGAAATADTSSAPPGQAAPTANPATPPPTPVPTTAAPVASVPFRYVGDKVVVDALLDGQGPYGLALDSGAETVMVSKRIADAAKLTTKTGTVELSGTTGGYTPVPQAQIAKLQIGSAVVNNPFTTLSPQPLPVDGYIGAPLFNSYIVQIDPGAHLVNLYAPDSYKPDPGDQAIPITLGQHRVPVVRGTIGGNSANFELDTGSAFPAELLPDFVKAHDLTQKFPKLGTVGTYSVHGPARSDIYALDDISFGADNAAGLRGKIPTVFLNPAAASAGDYDGRIGAPLLKRFVVTFDYPHGRMYLRTPAAAPVNPPAQPSPEIPTVTPPISITGE